MSREQTERNYIIFMKWQAGASVSELAVEYNLTPSRISAIIRKLATPEELDARKESPRDESKLRADIQNLWPKYRNSHDIGLALSATYTEIEWHRRDLGLVGFEYRPNRATTRDLFSFDQLRSLYLMADGRGPSYFGDMHIGLSDVYLWALENQKFTGSEASFRRLVNNLGGHDAILANTPVLPFWRMVSTEVMEYAVYAWDSGQDATVSGLRAYAPDLVSFSFTALDMGSAIRLELGVITESY